MVGWEWRFIGNVGGNCGDVLKGFERFGGCLQRLNLFAQ